LFFFVTFFDGPRASAEPSDVPPEVGFNSGLTDTGRSVAMSGALRAFSNSTEAIAINPANIASARVYHIGGWAEFWPQADRQSYGAAIVDSIVSRSRLSGAISGSYTKQDADGVDRSALDLRMSLAFPFSNQFFLGGTAHFLRLGQSGFPGEDALPPSGAAAGLDGEHIIRNFTFDGGLTLKPIPELSLGVVGYNLTDPGHGLAPLMVGTGAGYGSEDFTVEADLLFDFSTYTETQTQVMAGFEFLASDNYPIRLGYRHDDAWKMHSVSAGLGYLSQESASGSLRPRNRSRRRP
jgi:opacity protein-like surface antigen